MSVFFVIVFLNTLSFSITLPLLPILKVKLALSPLDIGIVASVFSLFSFIGNLFFGILSDVYGRKKLLIITALLTALCSMLMCFTYDFYSLLLLRVFAGFFAGNFAVYFATASDLSTYNQEAKSKAMGTLGAAMGLAFIVGPVMGGYISTHNPMSYLLFPFIISSVIALCTALTVSYFFRESNTEIRKTPSLAKSSNSMIITEESSKIFPISQKNSLFTDLKKQVVKILQNRVLLLNFAVVVLIAFSFSGIEVFFSIWQRLVFNATPMTLGLFWTSFSFIYTLSQYIIPKFITGKKALLLGIVIYGFSFLGLYLFSNYYYISLLIVILLTASSTGFIFPNISANIAMQSTQKHQGFIFAINQSSHSIGRVISGYTLGTIYHFSSINLVWITLFLSTIIVFWLIYYIYKDSNLTIS